MSWPAAVWSWLRDGAHWTGPDGIPHRLLEHVLLTGTALGLACLVGLPVGVWLGHRRRGGVLAVNVSNIGRAVPTLAILVLLALAPPPFGLGTVSTITALVLFALPPVMTNAYVGIREVDQDVVDAARGMGMTGWQILRQVELPAARPLLINGIRLAAVQVIATATIAALAAGGGLGRIIAAGYGRQDQAQLIAGALLVAALALMVEAAFALLAAASSGRR